MWTVKENPAWGKMLDVVDEDGKGVAYFQREEDAVIGAAAPELLEALETLMATHDGPSSRCPPVKWANVMLKAELAIKKARGIK